MLWSIFQAALLEPDHPINDDVKTNILSLSLFIDRKLFATLADPTPDKLAAVVKIHRLLAIGQDAL
jgi:flagellar protein FlaF